jgi:lipoprotein-anchoring transpeptidase ErfK/SrfK
MANRFIKISALISSALMAIICHASATETAPPPFQVLISVPDQRLAVVRDGELVSRFPVSTSRFGTGDNFYSYRTPLGALRVCDKIGGDLPPGAVIRHRAATGEVLPVNAPGRDPIVTRVIWLDGLEAQNKNARSRGIYIHGTPQEWTIGKPMSWGCIRMRSQDVIKFYDEIPVGTVVSIIPQKLPHMHRYVPPKEQPAAPPPDNAKPPEPAPVSLVAAAPKPSAAPEKPAPEPAKPSKIVPEMEASAPLPAIGEGPDHGNSAAWHAMKGSFLLATLPGWEKPGNPPKKATQ